MGRYSRSDLLEARFSPVGLQSGRVPDVNSRYSSGASRAQSDPALQERVEVGGVPNIVDDHQDVAVCQQVSQPGDARFHARKVGTLTVRLAYTAPST
jgi:hypothetical protein